VNNDDRAETTKKIWSRKEQGSERKVQKDERYSARLRYNAVLNAHGAAYPCRAARAGQKVESKEQRAESREQRAEIRERRAQSRAQEAESTAQGAERREQRAESRELRAKMRKHEREMDQQTIKSGE
jgi:hypothetical protein